MLKHPLADIDQAYARCRGGIQCGPGHGKSLAPPTISSHFLGKAYKGRMLLASDISAHVVPCIDYPRFILLHARGRHQSRIREEVFEESASLDTHPRHQYRHRLCRRLGSDSGHVGFATTHEATDVAHCLVRFRVVVSICLEDLDTRVSRRAKPYMCPALELWR